MSINILDLVKGQLTDSVIGKAAGFLGEDTQQTKSAFDNIMPALLGGLVKNASSESGASMLFNLIGQGGFDGGILDNVSDIFSGGDKSNSLLNSGGGIIDALFGNKVGGIIDLITNQSGIKRNSASSLLKMAAPLLMGLVGKQVKSQGLNTAGLAKLLLGQRDSLKAAAPAGLAGALGLSSMDEIGRTLVGDVKETVSNTAHGAREMAGDAAEAGGSLLNKLLPLLLLGLIAFLAFYFLKGCGGDIKDTTENMVENTAETVENVGEAITDKFKPFTLPGGEEIEIIEGTLNDRIVTFVENDERDLNTIFTFDRISFETGSARLTEESAIQVKNLGAILRAYPDAELTITGHTDNTGEAEANQKLSEDRAFAVKSRLVELGVDGDRVSTTGAGSTEPIADNDTEEGRLSNRRIDMKFEAL